VNHGKSKDEKDLQERSTEKLKETTPQVMEVGNIGSVSDQGNRSASNTAAGISYKQMVVGADVEVTVEDDMDETDQDSDDGDMVGDETEGIRVEEQKIGNSMTAPFLFFRKLKRKEFTCHGREVS
jgi:hypothetical protein